MTSFNMHKVRLISGKGVACDQSETADGETIFEVPEHIPPEVVRKYPLGRGKFTTELPHDIVSRIHREFPPAFYVPDLFAIGGGWIFRRAEDIRNIWTDPEHFSSRQIAPYAQFDGGTWSMVPAEQDPPLHGFYRKLLNPLFTPKVMAKRSDKLRKHARDYIAIFKDRGHCEILNDFALRFPIKVFLELMDMPESRVEEFLEWETTMLRSGDLESVKRATSKICQYLRSEIDVRKAAPGDDLIGFAIKSEINGRKLTDDELMGLCFNLYIGGMDTVSAHMSQIFRFLGENPEKQAYLRANPDKINAAIDEMMRALGSITLMRTCVKQTELAGVTVMPGEFLAASSALASRDPEEYSDADTVDFDRKSRLMSFGTGPHMCLGVHLATLELRLAIEEFLSVIPPFKVDPGAAIKSDLGVVFIPLSVPLVWDIAAEANFAT